MARKYNALTDMHIRNAKPKAKPYKLTDGQGLYVEIMPNGSKLWRLKYTLDGKENRLSIGAYGKGAVTLEKARKARDEARGLVKKGVSPTQHKNAIKQANIEYGKHTFESVATEWLDKVYTYKVAQGTHDQAKSRFKRLIFPILGKKPIASITAASLLECLREIESLTVAHKTRTDVGQVFKYAISLQYCQHNIAAHITGTLPPARRGHNPAITEIKRLGELLRAIDEANVYPTTRAALKILPILFVRKGELLKMEWPDMDLDEGVWHYTASKAKQNEEPIRVDIPFPTQVIDELKELQKLTGHGQYVFPNERDHERHMSTSTLNNALVRMKFKGEATPHGFRATARTILAERLNEDERFIEQQLGHRVRDPNGRAYNRTKFFNQRKRMLQAWADFLDQTRKLDNNVVPFKKQG